MENREEYQQLRDESNNNELLRLMVANMNGAVCCNCGSKECIEYHHIVPLAVGGTNRITNYVALCHKCHCAAHYGRHIRDYQNKKISGRPHNTSEEEITSAIEELIQGKIGRAECKKRVGLSGSSKIVDMSFYKRYIKEKGIKTVKNNIDIILKRRGFLRDGEVIGYVEYKDGTLTELYWMGQK